MSVEQALKRLQDQEKSGGIRYDKKGKIVPMSQHAIHLYRHIRDNSPPKTRWDHLSPEFLSQEEKDTDPQLRVRSLLERSTIFS